MAKSKSRTIDTEQVNANEANPAFVPVHKKYKPIPKFNGKCPNCN